MRSNHYKKFCINKDYDKVIDFIRSKNTFRGLYEAEEFASNLVNELIKAVIYPKNDKAYNGVSYPRIFHHCEKEICIVIRANTFEGSPNYRKVILAVKL